MVTYTSTKAIGYAAGGKKSLVEIACLSTDTKPTENIMNGSTCIEMDTGTVYFFDESAREWLEWGAEE